MTCIRTVGYSYNLRVKEKLERTAETRERQSYDLKAERYKSEKEEKKTIIIKGKIHLRFGTVSLESVILKLTKKLKRYKLYVIIIFIIIFIIRKTLFFHVIYLHSHTFFNNKTRYKIKLLL